MSLPDLERLATEGPRLRGVAADPAAVERAAAAAERELAEARGAAALRLLGYLGNAYRLLGRHEQALTAHERALALAEEAGDERALAVALTRLGESLRCAERLDDAEAVLRRALELAPAPVAHYALQHLGKTLLDRGAAAEAATRLEAALEQRRATGDAALVRSTERALAAARREER